MAVNGGVITSTFLTLLVVPVVYTWMDRFTLKKKLDTRLPPKPAVAAVSNLVRLTGDQP